MKSLYSVKGAKGFEKLPRVKKFHLRNKQLGSRKSGSRYDNVLGEG